MAARFDRKETVITMLTPYAIAYRTLNNKRVLLGYVATTLFAASLAR